MLTIIVTTLLISLIINIVLKKFELPTIIGYIITGTIITYGFGLHEATNNHDLKEIAEFGMVFLMFTIGLDFSVEHLKRMQNEVFIAGTLQIMITTLVIFLISYYIIDLEKKVSLIVSLAIALSSTAIVLKTFNETGDINKRFGQRTLGILIMQDIAVIPILLIIGFMSNDGGKIPEILLNMLISATILLFMLWIIGKYLLEPFFTQIIKTNSDELFIGTILFLAIGSSYLANVFGFSYSLGAFIAGMLIAETKYKHQAEAELIPFRDILLGIFFITVGMQIDFSIIYAYMHIILALLIGVIVLKFIIIYAIVRANENQRVSLKTAISLVQVGEFSLALLELARTNNLIGSPHGQIMIVTIVISMILTPFLLKNLALIADKLVKNDNNNIELDIDSALLKEHIVIIGFGGFGKSIAKVFKNNNELYIAIENNINNFHEANKNKEPVIFGNALHKEILAHANVKDAKSIAIAIDNPRKLLMICETIQKSVQNNKIFVRVHSEEEKEAITNLGITNVIVENQLSSNAFFELINNQ